MGTAGGEGLTPAVGRGDLQDSGEDVSIGNQNDSCGGNDDEGRENEQHNLVHKSVITRDLDQGWDVTEKVVQSVFSTETQTEGETCLHDGVDASTDVGSSHQLSTDFLRHVYRVKERGTNGRESIKCHDSQKEAFSCDK